MPSAEDNEPASQYTNIRCFTVSYTRHAALRASVSGQYPLVYRQALLCVALQHITRMPTSHELRHAGLKDPCPHGHYAAATFSTAG